MLLYQGTTCVGHSISIVYNAVLSREHRVEHSISIEYMLFYLENVAWSILFQMNNIFALSSRNIDTSEIFYLDCIELFLREM